MCISNGGESAEYNGVWLTLMPSRFDRKGLDPELFGAYDRKGY
jgi:hypothetical protein